MSEQGPQRKASGKPKIWEKTPTQNLVRYAPKGTYYLRARFGGEAVRESLHTTNYRVACAKLAKRIAELRVSALRSRSGPSDFAEALAAVRLAVLNDPALKTNTRRSYLEEIDSLAKGRPGALPTTPFATLTTAEMEAWWSRTAAIYAPQRANHLLMFARQAAKLARKAGALTHDPLEDLSRIKIPRTRLQILTSDQLRAVVENVRAQGKAHSDQAADWLEWMAYTGMRPGEIAAACWEHIDAEAGVVLVVGGSEGTKNREVRRVPMNAAFRDLLARMQRAGAGQGKVFSLKRPREALRAACARLGIPHQRIYDLRHLFATVCNSAGVDVPTFAKWLGHKDGGSLAMRTYVHPLTEHERQAANKVKF